NVAVMERSIGLLRSWFMEKWPELPRRHVRRHRYFADHYLANLALGRDDLALALRFQARAWRARPLGLAHPSSLGFVAKVLARVLGRSRSAGDGQAPPITFGDFIETEAAR